MAIGYDPFRELEQLRTPLDELRRRAAELHAAPGLDLDL